MTATERDLQTTMQQYSCDRRTAQHLYDGKAAVNYCRPLLDKATHIARQCGTDIAALADRWDLTPEQKLTGEKNLIAAATDQLTDLSIQVKAGRAEGEAALRRALRAAVEPQGVDGELRHARTWARIQRRLDNGDTIDHILTEATTDDDLPTLHALAAEAPTWWQNTHGAPIPDGHLDAIYRHGPPAAAEAWSLLRELHTGVDRTIGTITDHSKRLPDGGSPGVIRWDGTPDIRPDLAADAAHSSSRGDA
ncbi:MAG: hypothetical protein K1X95_06625 [Acidimicrobiia bacterium]|nr:hypothetical protein [Acidimicrobiia bacterium]